MAQLSEPTEDVCNVELQCLRRAAPGPGNWATPEDLWWLQHSYHFPSAFRRLRFAAQAAQLRVRLWDTACGDHPADPGTPLDFHFSSDRARPPTLADPPPHAPNNANFSCTFNRRTRFLRSLLGTSDRLQERATWDRWFQHSYHVRLDTNFSDLAATLGMPAELYCSVAPTRPAPYTEKDWGYIRTHFAATVSARLLQTHAPPAEFRVKHKYRRWGLNLPDPAHITSLFPVRQRTENWHGRAGLHHLRQLRTLVAPRVQSAVFSTMWDRWTTARRFQGAGMCVLCRVPHTQDSIEHYAKCPVVKRLAAQFLHLDPRQFVNLHSFLLVNPLVTTKETLTTIALLAYATYRCTNFQRHAQTPYRQKRSMTQ